MRTSIAEHRTFCKVTARHIMAGLLLLVLLAGQAGARNVVIVVIDGARYSETFGAESTYVPRIWNNLRPAGTIWTNFRNEGTTSTNPGHAAIATGTWQPIPNDGSQRPTMPTVFEYFRQASGAAATDAYVIVGKSKLNILSHSTHDDFGAAYAASVSIGTGDGGVIANALSVMNSSHPRLIMLNLADVDIVGHSGNWAGYLSAIRKADSLVHLLWSTIQADPLYRDSTTMFVTNDHGRHDDAHGGFTNHGDSCEGCRHLMLLAVGRGFPAGLSVTVARTQRDIAPTAGQLVGFSVQYAAGSSLLADTIRTSLGDAGDGLPGSFSLAQNYPNPFNPSTVISFSSPDAGHLRLAVFDNLGREVTVLVNGRRSSGSHDVDFDATGLSSGIYHYRLTARNFVQSRKMILLR